MSLQTDLASALPAVLGDRVQLQQVLINLVINGMEAMEPVTDRPRDLLIRSRHEAEQVLVAVQDSGTGIEPNNVDQVFDAFFTTKPRGMGMGLSISRSIIEAHAGRLWASPNAGPGATFQFSLPMDSKGQFLGIGINLITDAIEAMASDADWSPHMIIRSERHEDDHVLVAVQDSGVGIDPNDLDPRFNAFLTTKLGGMGMGLSIRSIIEAHGARLRATATAPHGAIFHLSLPIGPASRLRNIALNSSPSVS